MTQTAEQRRYVRLAHSINRKAARLGRDGRVVASDLGRAYLRSMGICTYCQIGIDPMHCSFDHVIPFDRGGPNEPTNIVACCMTCQRAKSKKTPDEFAIARVLVVECETCGRSFRPRYADWIRGYGRTCSARCAGKKGSIIALGAPR